jgi:hypothetical protein
LGVNAMSAVQPEVPVPACINAEERQALITWMRDAIDSRVKTTVKQETQRLMTDLLGLPVPRPLPEGFGVPVEVPEHLLPMPVTAKAG